jgi:multidrug efflux pump subunit AcrB
MNAPPGYNLATMHTIGREIQDELMAYVEDDPARFKRGETDMPALRYLFLRIEPENLRIVTESVDPDDIDAVMTALTRRYQNYAGMKAFASRGSIITSNDGGTRSISLDISGPRLEDIYAVAAAAYARAGEVFDNPRIKPDPPTLTLSQPLIEIHPKWDRAAELGMSAQDLGFTVAALTDGAFAGYFYQDDEKIDIYFYSRDRFDVALDSVGRMPVYTPGGTVVPLSTIAEVRETVDTSMIRRINAKRTVTLNIIPPKSIALETGVEMVRQDLVGHLQRTGQVPQTITMGISGASDQLEATRNALFGNYIVAIIVIYLLLVAVFSHWGYPVLIMTTIPLGVASGLVGLYLMNVAGGAMEQLGFKAFQQPFDMISMLGFLILMGTVVNNPILIVDRASYNTREMGMNAHDAISEAVTVRLRPIAMTTLTTIFGLAPLVFIPGAGTELYRGVGAIVLFGILGSAFVTLTFLPALTYFVLRYLVRLAPKPAGVPVAGE